MEGTRGEETAPAPDMSENICSRILAQLKVFMRSIFTLNFLKILLGGQALSLLICGTAITSQLLHDRFKVSAPTAQSFLNYLCLGLVYCVILCCRRDRPDNFYHVFLSRWWKYLLVALVDVEANYLVVKAYQYTTLTSVQLLDCITIPVVLLLSFVILRVSYRINHVVGVVICIIGVPLMVWADSLLGKTDTDDKPQKALGDALCLIGASLYGISNVAEEYVVRHFTRVEFLGMVGLFGTFISGIQLVILERQELTSITWNYQVVLLFLAFAICLFCLYSFFPVVIKWSSALVVNLSILTADFYSLIVSLFVFHYAFSGLYVGSFVVIVLGIIVYSILLPRDAQHNFFRRFKFLGRYQLFRNERSANSEGEANPDLTVSSCGAELTEEERESWHRAANETLNGTNSESPA
ncbi:solute carrier family 35 member F2-like [Acanthaster planci]|uniref:Solute carrier family 35 member F2-like n=1 Tax=Acanthaster planci TaxID=133434 RepID=A0A8B7YDX8_ACAPL|nr:solute carrier family 35 member F2-like [Acanthaster planci]